MIMGANTHHTELFDLLGAVEGQLGALGWLADDWDFIWVAL